MKFEEAFSTFDHCKHSIDEINKIYQLNPNVFLTEYKTSFLCPKCRLAKLSYNNAAIPYFRAYANAVHKDGCDLKQDEMSVKVAKKFAKAKENADLIQRQLTSLLNDFLEIKPLPTVAVESKSLSTATEKATSSVKKVTAKRISQKRIDLSMRQEDYNCFKYFYGKALLKWEKYQNGLGYKILLNDSTKHTLLCKIFVINEVYNKIPDEYKTPLQYNCNISFMALASEEEGKHYFKADLILSQHLLIQKETTPK